MLSKIEIVKSILKSIFINGFLTYITYVILSSYFSNLTSLIIAVLIPILENIFLFVKNKNVDIFGIFMFISILFSIIGLLFGGDEKIILLRESIVTGIMGVIMLFSLMFSKPIIYYFAIKFTTSDDDKSKSEFNEKWETSIIFRNTMKRLTLMWGLILVIECGVKIYLVYILKTKTILLISPFIFYGSIIMAIIFTKNYVKYVNTANKSW